MVRALPMLSECGLDTIENAVEPTRHMTTSQAADEVVSEAAAKCAQAMAKPRGAIWMHFERLPDRDGKKMAKCIYCGREYVCNNSSTGNMWKHLKKAHPEKIGVKQSGPGSFNVAFSPAVFREALTEWIVDRDQPFSEVDAPSFHKLVDALNPGVNVPSNDSVRRDIDKRFGHEKGRVGGMLRDAPGCLSFGIDGWTSPKQDPFQGTVAHWIDANWQLRSLVLDMAPLTGSHTGENLCASFMKSCNELGVLPKLLAITTDGALSNNTLAAHLEAKCRLQGIPFDQNSMHVHCIAHVINLAVQDFLKTLNASALDCEEAYNAGDEERDGADAGFIPRLRKLVFKVRSSPQRLELFAHQCDTAGIRPKKLVVDVRTRWNSTHDMITRALELRKPLDAMTVVDSHLLKYSLKDGEWRLLRDIRKFFRIFKRASLHLCAVSHPTLATAVPVYNFMIDSLEDYRDADGCDTTVKAAANAAINRLKKSYSKTGAEVYVIATVLDPRFKFRYVTELANYLV
jgi:hypothetical protein